MQRNDVSRWIARGLYLLALFLLTSPIADVISAVWPVRPDNVLWRYTFLEFAGSHLHTPILGISLALLVAIWTRNDLLLRFLGVVMILASVLLLPAMGILMVDLLQILVAREAQAEQAILAGGMILQIKYGGASVVLAALGIGARRTAQLRS